MDGVTVLDGLGESGLRVEMTTEEGDP